MSATVFLDTLRPGPRADEIVSRLTDGPNTSTPDKAEAGSQQVEVFFLEPETDHGEARAALMAVLNEIGGTHTSTWRSTTRLPTPDES